MSEFRIPVPKQVKNAYRGAINSGATLERMKVDANPRADVCSFIIKGRCQSQSENTDLGKEEGNPIMWNPC